MCKREIVALMSVCMCLMAMAQTRISLFHQYDWSQSPTGAVTVTPADPFYSGGWTVTLQPEADGDHLIAIDGLTNHRVAQPLLVDYRTGTVTLEVNGDEPCAVVSGTSTTVSAGVTTTIDSVMSYYVVNEGWVAMGALEDIPGEVLADGTIHIPGGFAYYIETAKTTTITGRDGTTRTFTDQTDDVTRIYRDLWLYAPNGKHEFTDAATGKTRQVDVYISQSNDTVTVVNLYGYGSPEVVMILSEDGTMSFPSQMLRDIDDSESPAGEGMWYNATMQGGQAVGGNTGNATTQVITWGLTTPWDHSRTWSGWDNNRLYYTDGTKFVLSQGPVETWQMGDVNHDGEVDVADVALAIKVALGQPVEVFYPEQANLDSDPSSVDVGDVSILINLVLGK